LENGAMTHKRDPLLDDPTRGRYGEDNDCAVRALASATRVSYAEAHRALAAVGRHPRDGTYWRQLTAALEKLAVAYAAPYGLPFSTSNARVGLNTRQFKAQHSGRWIVSLPRHFTALADGDYSDYVATLPRARAVTGAVCILSYPRRPTP
jgi:hypothetical protein